MWSILIDVIAGLDDLVKENLRLSGQQVDIAALAQQVCRKYNISLGELRSGTNVPIRSRM
ncbi:MAG: hypothetical protein V3V39_05140 [Desulfobacterales bacterium]